MKSDNQQINKLFSAKMENIEYIVNFVTNFVLKDIIKNIWYHKLILIIFVKENN